jgi:hypothetical protein
MEPKEIWDRVETRYGLQQDSDWLGLRSGYEQMSVLNSFLLKSEPPQRADNDNWKARYDEFYDWIQRTYVLPEADLASQRADREHLQVAKCKCGVALDVSHYCSALDHCWLGKRQPPNPHGEHLAPNGKPIDGYPEQQA